MKKIILLIIFILLLTGCNAYDSYDDSKITTEDIEYSEVASNFINTVKKKVGTSIAIFDENSLYLIPVGSTNTGGCNGTEDFMPYGVPHIYAYVGVIKKGSSYTFYYVSRDELGNGYNFTNEKTVNSKGRYIYKGDELNNYKYLAKTYNVKGKTRDKTTEVLLKDIDVNDSIRNTIGQYLNIEKVKIYTYSVCK